ncbi:MAG: hypothetical protein JXJ17_04755 [Anaerolineae bacterium]|nr:hypothetical protein [Anaerolineae bacterium]
MGYLRACQRARLRWALPGLLFLLSLLITGTAASAPLEADKSIDLDYGEYFTERLVAYERDELYEPYVYKIEIPKGAELLVSISQPSAQYCFFEAAVYVPNYSSGDYKGRATVNAGSISDSFLITLPGGDAEVWIGSTQDCDYYQDFPVYVYPYFEVFGSSSYDDDSSSDDDDEDSWPDPVVEFGADSTSIVAGQCVRLTWYIEYISAAYLRGGGYDQGVEGPSGSIEVCPVETTEYRMEVQAPKGSQTVKIVITVVQPTAEPTDTPRPTSTSRPTSTPQPTSTSTPTEEPTPDEQEEPEEGEPEEEEEPPTATPTPDEDEGVMPPYLVLTHKGRLNTALGLGGAWDEIEGLLDDHYGHDNYSVLDYEEELGASSSINQYRDLLLEEVRSRGWPKYIIVMGGPNIVPFGTVTNPCSGVVNSDNDTIFTDDWYADLDQDGAFMPDVPVTRVPDGGNIELIRAIFQANERSMPSGSNDVFSYGQPLREFAEDMVIQILRGNTDHPDWGTVPIRSSPLTSGGVDVGLVDAQYTYFILHGNRGNTASWWGEDPDVLCSVDENGDRVCPSSRYPTAFDVSQADSQGLVISAACYGAYINDGQTTANSIALNFLQNGAFAFIGSTATTYSTKAQDEEIEMCRDDGHCFPVRIVGEPLGRGHQRMDWSIFNKVSQDQMHPVDAYLSAKLEQTGLSDPTCGEQKAIHSYVYYGLPPTS